MKKLILVLCCLSLQILFAQETSVNNQYGGYSPSAPITPKGEGITSASSTSINKSTGAVSKSLPIYTISESSFNWPVGLNYSYTGLKVIHEPSMVGLGWHLNASASISREVRGLPDDHPNGYHGTEQTRRTILEGLFNRDISTLNDVIRDDDVKLLKERQAYLFAQGKWDGELDVFHVNVGKINFSFKLDNNLEPILLSEVNVKVDFTWNSITVTDTNGVQYEFSVKELYEPNEDGYILPDINGNTYNYTNTWYISKITLPDSSNEVLFNYMNYTLDIAKFTSKSFSKKASEPEFLEDIPKRDTVINNDTIYYLHPDDVIDGGIYPYARVPMIITRPVISSILFSEGSLNFVSELEDDYPVFRSINLKNNQNEIINNFVLNQSIQGRRFLDSIDKDGELLSGFEYYKSDVIPEYAYNVQDPNDDNDLDEVNIGFDFWGYYNGQIGKNYLRNDGVYGFDKFPSFYSARIGALKQINHKTGGDTQIEYEPHTIKHEFDSTLQKAPFNRRILLKADYIDHTAGVDVTFDQDTYAKISYNGRVKIGTSSDPGTAKIILTNGGALGNTSNSYYNINSDAYDLNCHSVVPFLNDITINEQIVNDNYDNPSAPPSIYFGGTTCNYVIIPAGTYSVSIETNEYSRANIQIDYSGGVPDLYNQTYGGIRVSKIEDNPKIGKTVTRVFNYNDEEGYSTGNLSDKPIEDLAIGYYSVNSTSANGTRYIKWPDVTVCGVDIDPDPLVYREYPCPDLLVDYNTKPFYINDKQSSVYIFYRKVSETLNPVFEVENTGAVTPGPGGIPIPIENPDGSTVNAIPDSYETVLMMPKEGYTTYEFESPYQFRDYYDWDETIPFDFASGDFFHENINYYDPPKGVDRTGIRLAKVSNYNSSESIDFDSTKLESEKQFVYEKFMVAVDSNDHALDSNYPKSLKVTTQKGKEMNNIIHDLIFYSDQLEVPISPQLGSLSFNFYLDHTKSTQDYYNEVKILVQNIFPIGGLNSPIGKYVLKKAYGANLLAMNTSRIPFNTFENLGPFSKGDYVLTEYKEVNALHKQKQITSKAYFGETADKNSDNIQDFTYDSYLQLKESIATNSKGEVLKTVYYYPYDFPLEYQTLIDQNKIANPVITEVYQDNILMSRSKVEFDLFNGKYLPARILSAKGTNNYEIKTSFLSYDTQGNPLEVKQEDGIHTIFIWGYNNDKLLAKITNSSYVGMPTAVNDQILATKNNSNNDVDQASEDILISALQALRNNSHFANSQVMSYTYDPLIGVTNTIDNRNRVSTYKYDSKNRLQYIIDNEGKVLQEYTYNFAINNQQ